MKACPFCAEQIQDAAIVCRFCGRELPAAPEAIVVDAAPARRPESQVRANPALVFIGVVAALIFAAWSFSPASRRPGEIRAADTECRTNLQCWADKHSSAAEVRCQAPVERLAKYSHKWTDGVIEPKFSRFRWLSTDKGTVTYLGDKVQFQNGFGAFQNHVYECDYDPEAEKVLDARARPGSLD